MSPSTRTSSSTNGRAGPRLRVDDGVRASISWPEPAIVVGRDRMGTGVALSIGPEPDYRWKPFTEEVVGIAKHLEARVAIGLGAFPIASPHTRPIKLISTASKPELTRKVGFMHGSVDVPAGIGEVIGHALDEAGIPSIGLWARAPHYVAAMPFAPATLARRRRALRGRRTRARDGRPARERR